MDSLRNVPTKMLTSVYDAHKKKNSKNNSNGKRVIGIAQLILSAVLIKNRSMGPALIGFPDYDNEVINIVIIMIKR